jgi:hypothetical protein
MQAIITFSTVFLSDKRMYFCNASNIAGSASLIYTVNVIPSVEDSSLSQALIIGGGTFLSLLGLIAIPATYLIYRLRKQVF